MASFGPFWLRFGVRVRVRVRVRVWVRVKGWVGSLPVPRSRSTNNQRLNYQKTKIKNIQSGPDHTRPLGFPYLFSPTIIIAKNLSLNFQSTTQTFLVRKKIIWTAHDPWRFIASLQPYQKPLSLFHKKVLQIIEIVTNPTRKIS